MASNKVQELWGDAIGITSLSDYTARTGGRYLRWSYDYVGSTIKDINMTQGPGQNPPPTSLPPTDTANDGLPGPIVVGSTYPPGVVLLLHKRLQLFASFNGYTGPLDGVMGVNSWIGVQRGFRAYGYNGPLDGAPGTNTFMAMQRVASKFGYTGPIDGVLGTESYKGFAKFLNTL